ncbi:MAG: protein translocase subunit SecD [Nocardioidaceae bacterium]
MATKTSRPGRTLVAFFLVVIALYAAVAAAGQWSPKLGLDLQGGTSITLQAKAVGGQSITSDKISQARNIIEQRVNGTGVSEAQVSTQGGNQIVVEIPGKEKQNIANQIGKTALLRFRLVWAAAQGTGTTTPPTGPTTGPTTAPTTAPTTGPTTGPTKPGSTKSTKPTKKPSTSKQRGVSSWMVAGLSANPKKHATTAPPTSAPTTSPTTGPTTPVAQVTDWTKLSLDDALKMANRSAPPSDFTGAYSALQSKLAAFSCPGKTNQSPKVNDVPTAPLITCDQQGQKYLLSPAIIEGTQLTDASAGLQQGSAQWQVNLSLNGSGSSTFATVSQALAQSNGGTGQFGIVLDGQVISAPTVVQPINGGQAQISGNFTQSSASSLANSLKYGALPLSFKAISVQAIGPTLASTQLDAGLLAGIVGLILVVIYCLLYYRGLGLVVIASLAMSAAITYSLVLLLGKGLGFTLTLPGIAGLIVAIGITADSFIVFFERLRDEVRDGKSLRLAVEAGWKRARMTVVAADTVSFLAAMVLYIFAIGVVRGFAFALGLTTLIDVALVFFFTKPLVSILARTKFFGQGHKLSGFDSKHLGIEGRSVSQMGRARRRTQEGNA